LRRETAVRRAVLGARRTLRETARSGDSLLLGPFLGEIGYELLYWIPFVRRELREAGVEPGQVTVLTRGGAGAWYADIAEGRLDALDLVEAETFLARLEERRQSAGDAKQLLVEPFDRELVAAARRRLGAAALLHPGLMFASLRDLWFRDGRLEDALARLQFRALEPEREPPPGLPERYVAVKAYFNDCLPETQLGRERLHALVSALAAEIDVVLLSTGLAVDDHVEWDAPAQHVHRIDHLLRPHDNLAVQTSVIANARGLLATYGGFSYLGPFLGTPTLTLLEREGTVPVHYEVLRAAFPAADYERVAPDDRAAVDRFASRCAA
jgi:hypothetical protein